MRDTVGDSTSHIQTRKWGVLGPVFRLKLKIAVLVNIHPMPTVFLEDLLVSTHTYNLCFPNRF